MAKINKKNRRRRTHHPVVTVVVILFLIGVLIFVSKLLVNRTADDAEDNKKSNPETSQNKKAEKTPTEDNSPSDDNEHKTPIQNDGEDPNIKDSLTGVLTMADILDGVLRIRVNIDQYLSSGTCKLTLYSESGKTFTVDAAIIPSASTSTCEGFDISTSNLSSGHWYISIDLESSDKTGIITGETNL